jgi:hypothetical protein
LKICIRGIASACIALFALRSHADWFTGTINRMQIGVDNHLVVYVDALTNHQCGSKRLDFAGTTPDSLKFVYAALLSWEAQGKTVQFAITNCNGAYGLFSYVEDLK